MCTFQGVSCLLRWLCNTDGPLHGLIAGLLAGSSLLFYRSSSVALYLASKLVEVSTPSFLALTNNCTVSSPRSSYCSKVIVAFFHLVRKKTDQLLVLQKSGSSNCRLCIRKSENMTIRHGYLARNICSL